jgi:hypothetical protein
MASVERNDTNVGRGRKGIGALSEIKEVRRRM